MNVCLNLIVRNEAHVIERCLQSCHHLCNSWLVVDTGSTDNTIHKIEDLMYPKPGRVLSKPWKNFGHNRTEALNLAKEIQKPDYLLFIDADEVFQYSDTFQWPDLTAEAYNLNVEYSGVNYTRMALVRADLPWRWVGVLHEYLECDKKVNALTFSEPVIFVRHDGARSKDPNTYKKDIQILEDALYGDPTNARNAFYLAQSYRDAGLYREAMKAYQHRSQMPGWDEETWYAMYEVGNMQVKLGIDPHESYIKAYDFRPTRAESLYKLALFNRTQLRYQATNTFAKLGVHVPRTNDRLFVDAGVYGWKLLDELSISSFYIGDKKTGIDACAALLSGRAPQSEHARILRNLEWLKGL